MNTKDLARYGKIAIAKYKGKGVLPADFEWNVEKLDEMPIREISKAQEKKVIKTYKELGMNILEIK